MHRWDLRAFHHISLRITRGFLHRLENRRRRFLHRLQNWLRDVFLETFEGFSLRTFLHLPLRCLLKLTSSLWFLIFSSTCFACLFVITSVLHTLQTSYSPWIKYKIYPKYFCLSCILLVHPNIIIMKILRVIVFYKIFIFKEVQNW